MRVFLPVTAEGGPKLELREVQAAARDARYNGLPVGGARLDDEGEITIFSTTAATFATQLLRTMDLPYAALSSECHCPPPSFKEGEGASSVHACVQGERLGSPQPHHQSVALGSSVKIFSIL